MQAASIYKNWREEEEEEKNNSRRNENKIK